MRIESWQEKPLGSGGQNHPTKFTEFPGTSSTGSRQRLGGLLRYYYREAAWSLFVRVFGQYAVRPPEHSLPVCRLIATSWWRSARTSRACHELWARKSCTRTQGCWHKLGIAKRRSGYPSDVSDEEWSFCAPYLTLMKEDAPQREHSLRELYNGLRWFIRAGCPWRMMPNDLPPWQAVQQQTQALAARELFRAPGA